MSALTEPHNFSVISFKENFETYSYPLCSCGWQGNQLGSHWCGSKNIAIKDAEIAGLQHQLNEILKAFDELRPFLHVFKTDSMEKLL
jgi:hypothetical protein